MKRRDWRDHDHDRDHDRDHDHLHDHFHDHECAPFPHGRGRGRERGRGAVSRVQAYFRFRMHRRIFMWFGATIFMTLLLVFLVMRALGGQPQWHRDFERGRTFVEHRYAEVWSDAPARHQLTRSTAEDLDVDVELLDTHGARLDVIGESCKHPYVLPIEKAGQPLGEVRVCADRHYTGTGWKIAVPLLISFAMLWGASGAIARRVSRPLWQLAQIAEDLGRGQLASRRRIGHNHHGEVRILAEALDDMAMRIEKQLADQRALLATVSHEIRTPLARIRLLVELAKDSPDKAAAAKILDDLDREVVEIDTLVGDLLASSRIDFTAITKTHLDANDVAQGAVERTGIDPTKLVVESPHVTFEGDATLVARAVANLIENANRHGGGATTVRVVGRGGDRRGGDRFIAFEVEDDGEGFAAGEEEKVFEPFYRPAGAGSGGVGLGLALVKRIAEAHGGRAYARNRDGGGALVGIELSTG
ncbi:MAG: sensor histidine kinase [Myxococcaceae bacterium]|nr:sensor histidine kinase [Myxococcaceae bacterium]